MVDQTGRGGTFDFIIEYPLESTEQFLPRGPLFVDAMYDQLGLKLESTKGSYPVLVIDHVERPSEN